MSEGMNAPQQAVDRDRLRSKVRDKIRIALLDGVIKPEPYIWIEHFERKYPNLPHSIWASYDDCSGLVSVYRDAPFGHHDIIDEFYMDEPG